MTSHNNPRHVPPVEAMRVDTGLGKTEETLRSFAARRARGGDSATATRVLIYTVDRHRLGESIEQRFAQLGVRVKVFRGRTAPDPNHPGESMCLNPRAVALAMRTHADINSACCQQGEHKCPMFDRCGYQRQKRGPAPDVWIVAHDMLFHTQPVFGAPAAVVIDEAMWSKGIRGIEREENEIEWVVALDSLNRPARGPLDLADAVGMRDFFRRQLGQALRQQPEDGGVERKHLEPLHDETCRQALKLEWSLLPKIAQHPGMTEAEIRALENDGGAIDAIQHTRRVIRIWEEVRELSARPEIAVSGRLTLKQHNGQRVVEWRGVAKISAQFQVPTLILDATLPPLPLLQVYHPQVEIVADIKVAMPAATRIRQILKAPTSANKLASEDHLEAMRRHILQRWIETGRGATLVICQQKVEEWLRGRLPGAIELAHYNDIAGLDEFKWVRLLILIGRTAPGPRAMEALAGALSGAQPTLAADGPNGFAWYDRIKQGIRLRDDRGIRTFGDRHPDSFVEMVRWQIHEGELIQALGRARGVNRTAATPLDVDLLFDACLPITVDEVVLWRSPSLLIAPAAEGVMLTASVDLMKLWPELWPNEKAAYRTVQQGVPSLPAFERVDYQLAGAKLKRRVGYFDRTLIPDPCAWLQEKLGPLAPL
jgi:hypothetical protein